MSKSLTLVVDSSQCGRNVTVTKIVMRAHNVRRIVFIIKVDGAAVSHMRTCYHKPFYISKHIRTYVFNQTGF